MNTEHIPVMSEQVIAGLNINPAGVYVDATFGRGGHSRQILDKLAPEGKLLVIDKDPDAIMVARKLAENDSRVMVKNGSFAELNKFCDELELTGKIAGIIMDLGVSSPQLADSERGFSFQSDGPLDMRMDSEQELSAAHWIKNAEEAEIAKILWEYGEERFSRRIAREIVAVRDIEPITRTKQLVEIIVKSIFRREKHKHPATRSFQAIRIFINNELGDLQTCLDLMNDVLAPEGRLVVISFHSLEDRIVKRHLQKLAGKTPLFHRQPILIQPDAKFTLIGKKYMATADEINQNPRARSAVLRVAEKLQVEAGHG